MIVEKSAMVFFFLSLALMLGMFTVLLFFILKTLELLQWILKKIKK